jgi:hypothetical protein
MKVEPHKWDRVAQPQESWSCFAWSPSIVLSIPSLDSQQLVGPFMLEGLPGGFSAWMRKYCHPISCLDSFQHFVRR